MQIFKQLKLGALALQIARNASTLLLRIGADALKAILREVVRLEIEEPSLAGSEKFERLRKFVRSEFSNAATSIDLIELLVSGLVAWLKGTGLFQSRVNANETDGGPHA